MSYRTALACVVAVAAIGCGEPPQIDSLSATTAMFGDEIEVTGAHFEDSNDVGFGDAGFLSGVTSDDGETLRFTVSGVIGACALTQLGPNEACPSIGIILEPGTYDIFVATACGDSNTVPLVIEPTP